jgi:hypothetical protein
MRVCLLLFVYFCNKSIALAHPSHRSLMSSTHGFTFLHSAWPGPMDRRTSTVLTSTIQHRSVLSGSLRMQQKIHPYDDKSSLLTYPEPVQSICKIWSFHSGDYEEGRLMGCVGLVLTDVPPKRHIPEDDVLQFSQVHSFTCYVSVMPALTPSSQRSGQ